MKANICADARRHHPRPHPKRAMETTTATKPDRPPLAHRIRTINKPTLSVISVAHQSLARQTYMDNMWIPPPVCHFYKERNPASGDKTLAAAVVFPNGGISLSLQPGTNRLSVCRWMDLMPAIP